VFEVEIGCQSRSYHQADGKWIAERPVQLGHDIEVHAVDTGDHGRRQKNHGGNGKDLDDLALLEVDKTDRGIHEEVDLVEQKRDVTHQRVHIGQDIARHFTFFGAG